MAKSPRNRTVLVGAIAILALALSAVIPVLAQTGTGGSGSQAGNTVVIQSGDTLGTLVTRYNFKATDLQDFFSRNTALVLTPGQTVTFPSGVTVNLPNSTSGQGAATGTATTTSGTMTGTGTATTTAGSGSTSGGSTSSGTTATGTATTSAGTGSSSSTTSGSTSSSGSVFVTATPGQTYVTQANDTLGTVLGFMGFNGANASTSGSGSTSTTAQATGTTSASTGGGATSATATGTSSAGTTGSGTSATAQATGTTSAGTSGAVSATGTSSPAAGTSGSTSGSASGSTNSTVTTQQLQEFVSLNQNLTFTAGQTANMPAGVVIPQTGAATGTGTSSTGSVATGTATTSAGTTGTATTTSGTTGSTTSTPAAGANSGTTTYTVQSGDTLQSIANRYGITLQQLVAMNPNLLSAGQTLNVPSSTSGSIPQTGNNTARSYTIQNTDTLGAIVSRFNLGQRDLGQFFSANCALTLQPGQTVRFPAGSMNSTSGSTGTTGGTTTQAATATPAATATTVPTATTAATATTVPTATTAATATTMPTATTAATMAASPTTAATATTAAGASGTTAQATGTATTAAGGTTIQATGTATTAAGGTTTQAATATTMPTATTAATATTMPTATTAATATPAATATTAAGTSSNQANTYTTQQGDTLCQVLNMMGVNLTSGSSLSNNTSGSSTSAATATPVASATTAAGASGTTVQATGTATTTAGGTTTQATGTATPAAGTSGSTSSGTTSGSTSSSNNGQANTSTQDTLLWNWYLLNRGLKFDNGQTVTVPAGIPATGGSTSANVSMSPVQQMNYGLCNVGPGSGIYVVKKGETLQSIANKFGISISDITDRNPGVQSVSRGQHLLMPGVEGAGLWDNSLLSNPYFPDCGGGSPSGTNGVPPSR